jgi:Family of unknown function (DUF5681)
MMQPMARPKKKPQQHQSGTVSGAVSSVKRRQQGGPGNPAKIVPYQFKKGQSGNPDGRPKSTLLSKAYRELLETTCPSDSHARTYAMLIAERLVKQAVTNEKYCVSAAAELADRTEGRPRQAVDLSGKLENPASSEAVLLAQLFSPEALLDARKQLATRQNLNGAAGRSDSNPGAEPD